MVRLLRSDDFRRFAELVRDRGIKRTADRLFHTKSERVESAWEHVESDRSNWWELEEVTKRWNRLITGNPSLEYQAYVVRKYFSHANGLRGLSIGCGAGTKEIRWAATGKFSVIEAYDVSEPRILHARDLAQRSKKGTAIRFEVGDVYRLDLSPSSFDLVIFDNSLHHCSPLDPVLEKSREWLRARGILVLNEYVGPDRFQWTDKQVEITNAVLQLLPPELRRMKNGGIKTRMERYSSFAIRLNDPSEAVESSSILGRAERYFRVVELKPYGGTIVANVLKGIAHNFQGAGAEARQWLSLLFTIEDYLLGAKAISSDYVFAVLRR